MTASILIENLAESSSDGWNGPKLNFEFGPEIYDRASLLKRVLNYKHKVNIARSTLIFFSP
jgi:KaiC/GvpD/RAD55 family RecA-like ATPase